MMDMPTPEDLHHRAVIQDGMISALFGLVTSMLQAMPMERRLVALKEFERGHNRLASVMLNETNSEGDWGIEGAELVRSTIAKMFPQASKPR